MIFRGRFEYTIDTKGRVNVPARFREQLQEGGQNSFVLTNYSGCLCVYPAGEWSRIEQQVAARVSSVHRKLNTFLRFFIGGAVEVVPDKQGRILIPPSLRAYAGLERDVVITGMLKRFEIWSREKWEVEVGRFEKEGLEDSDLTREINELGI
ncbi:MAG: division/cell wall cluster transcriptional repressor MraZ [Gemmatimonadota bacterium]